LVILQIIDDSGFRTNNILCMPIYNSENKIVGVTQLINKLNNQPFNENDANIIEVSNVSLSDLYLSPVKQ